jgi:hypothetical protein
MDYYNKDASFQSLLRFLQCEGVMTLSEWEHVFGEVSPAAPWGSQFWPGFRNVIMPSYWQHATKRRWLEQINPEEVWFCLPLNFSKASAARECSPSNPPSNSRYPGFCYRHGEDEYVICAHMALRRSQPWKVHKTWIHSRPRAPPSPVHFEFTTTTVKIEEIPDDETEKAVEV